MRKSKSLRERIYSALQSAGRRGLTRDEVCAQLKLTYPSGTIGMILGGYCNSPHSPQGHIGEIRKPSEKIRYYLTSKGKKALSEGTLDIRQNNGRVGRGWSAKRRAAEMAKRGS